MNEGKKTGLFWGVAAVMLGIAVTVAWPRTYEESTQFAGNELFEKFTDPLAASSMKIVTFDESTGQLDTFEVRKDRQSGAWTIPSREGYPADAIEQMKNAANALVGLKILDIQTSNAEDHDDLGVAEPKLEDLEVGDTGVGRLVSFKDDSQQTLASLIIGDSVKNETGKRYVRIPNQDPVYVVKFDETALTTNFRDWIEDDLLQLSSIDISDVEIKDYTATLGQRGISLSRKYTADVKSDGSQWTLVNLLEFDPSDPRAEPTQVDVSDDRELNKTKLDAMKNALDDLKIVNVYRKPEGVSATLKASADLLSDNDAITSLAERGFYPIDIGPGGEAEILSANGEMSVSLKDGVKYVLRFGNIAGVSGSRESVANDSAAEGDAEAETDGEGVNRYLLVTTMVDESKFPAPELKPIPQTLDELETILNPATVDESDAKGESDATDEPDATDEADVTDEADANAEPADEDEPEMKPEDPAPAEPATSETETDSGAEPAVEQPQSEGEAETTGSGETTGAGQAQEDSGDDQPRQADEPVEEVEADTDDDVPSKPADETLTDEEKQERLEAEQEKITKANQRKLDARKDKLETAQRRVRDLNARFADWYYVIPEDTYSKLRIQRDELFANQDDASADEASPPNSLPQFNFPGAPGK